MGTRGLYGIRKNDIDKCTYNHYDSYPSYLGSKILEFCKNNDVEDLKRLFFNIEMVDEHGKPTEEQIRICKEGGYADFSVSSGSEQDWYCLLRNLQGNFDAYQKGIDEDLVMFMTEGIDFIKNSLFCEYAYIINLDTEMLEYYEGSQHSPQDGNRYGRVPMSNGYYPCALKLEIPLDEIDDIDEWVNQMEYGENYEEIQDLMDKWDLDEDEAKELVEDDITEIPAVYDDYEDVGQREIDELYDIPDWIKDYIDLKGLGQSLVRDDDYYRELDSGRIVVVG